ncbi:MAG: outer-rane lipoprotein lolB [Gammaproteobacteria bacterium]|nr:outer-rane lipoprotein lolB [Gammaproteobacteria bacterium]
MLRCCVVLGVALAAACAELPQQGAAETAAAFELTGRIAVRFQDRRFSSALRWKQDAGGDEIWFTAPLGQTIAYLRADGGAATLTTADQKHYRAGSIESLTRSALGWRLPVAGLRNWVLGQPAPGVVSATVERDDASRITRFKQDDLQIAFSYAESGATRPSRIEVVGSEAEMRFVIDSLTTLQP